MRLLSFTLEIGCFGHLLNSVLLVKDEKRAKHKSLNIIELRMVFPQGNFTSNKLPLICENKKI